MPDTAPIPTINSISIEGEDYQIEDTVARARADALALSIYEVGDLYFSMNSASPAARFGGEWEQLTDVFIRAANDTETGGADSISITTAQMPRHNHAGYSGGSIIGGQGDPAHVSTNGTSFAIGWNTSSSGSGNEFSVMPAYQDVYVWKRVA